MAARCEVARNGVVFAEVNGFEAAYAAMRLSAVGRGWQGLRYRIAGHAAWIIPAATFA
jgi:hypothetical protein